VWKERVNSVIFGFILLLGFTLTFNLINFNYYITIRRVTYIKSFDATLLGSSNYDLIALIILLSIILVLKFKFKDLLFGLTLPFLFLEVLAFIQLILYPIEDPFLSHFLNLRNQIFYSFGTFSKYIMILVLVFWALKPFIKEHSLRIEDNNKDKYKFLILLIAIILSIIIPLYPYLPKVNPEGFIVSVDVPNYIDNVNKIKEEGLSYEIIKGDRPLALIIIYFLHSILGLEGIKFLPTLLSPLLVISVYFLVKETLKDKFLASVSSFLTSTSHYIIVGIYGGFFANWIALILMMFYISFLLKKKPIASLLLILILFTHPYTWTPLMLSTLLFFFLFQGSSLKERLKGLKEPMLIIILPNVFADIFKVYFIGGVGGTTSDYSLAINYLSLEGFSQRFLNLDFTFSTYVGGYLSNPLILLLSLLALINPYKNNLIKFISCLVLIISIPSLLGNYVIQSRLFYLLPFPILASLYLRKDNNIIVLLFTFMVSLNYAFFSLINLPL